MSENLKTIKELADKLGVSKDKIKYRVRKLPSELTTKVNGITYLKNKAVEIICEDIGVKTPSYSEVEIPTQNTHSKNDEIITIPTDYLLEELKKKDNELENKNNQIDNLIEAQKQTQNLLDQQQRLALQDKQMLNEYKSENNKLKALKTPNHNIEQEREFAETMRATYEEELVKLNQELSEQQKLREQAEEERNELMEKQRKLLAREQSKNWWKFWLK